MIPSSYTPLTFIPYENGVILSLANKAAADGLTVSPTAKIGTEFSILILPLIIFVVILRAWKKVTSAGGRPVSPFGTITSQLLIYPILATLHSRIPSIAGLTSATLASVKIKATLFLINGTKAANLEQSFYSKRSFLHS